MHTLSSPLMTTSATPGCSVAGVLLARGELPPPGVPERRDGEGDDGALLWPYTRTTSRRLRPASRRRGSWAKILQIVAFPPLCGSRSLRPSKQAVGKAREFCVRVRWTPGWHGQLVHIFPTCLVSLVSATPRAQLLPRGILISNDDANDLLRQRAKRAVTQFPSNQKFVRQTGPLRSDC